jgi:hypothetical protein
LEPAQTSQRASALSKPRSLGNSGGRPSAVAKHGIDEALLSGAITIKNLAGQINVVIHAV